MHRRMTAFLCILVILVSSIFPYLNGLTVYAAENEYTEYEWIDEAETPSVCAAQDEEAVIADATDQLTSLTEEEITEEAPEVGETIRSESVEINLDSETTVALEGKLPVGGIAQVAEKISDVENEVTTYDINVQDDNGDDWEPEEQIKVTIENEEYAKLHAQGYNITIQHVHGEEIEYIDATIDGSTITFYTESFSDFTVIWENLIDIWEQAIGFANRVTTTILSEADVTISLSGRMPRTATVEAIEEDVQIDGMSNVYAFDISLMNQGSEIQPQNGAIEVEICGEEIRNAIEAGKELAVFHIADDGTKTPVEDFSVDGDKVKFEAESFSVYTIQSHEGGEVETPRVTFHFLDSDYVENVSENSITYTAGPYEFINTSTGSHNVQTTQIVQDGETLEMIENPPNNENYYFFGWYIVDPLSVDNSGNVTYQWTADPEQLVFESPVTVTQGEDGVTWTLNGAVHIEEADEEGSAHVYVAPIYKNYYFVNFHLGAKEETTAANILARKLVPLGNDNLADVRIGNITAPSEDAKHLVFTGWETITENGNVPITDVSFNTIDEDGRERNYIADMTGEERPYDQNGYYLTVGPQTIDLYPVFTEARWINFNTGKSGNGALYVGARYLLTSNTHPHYLTSFATSKRNGYIFKGWYANPTLDAYGNVVSGTQITDENGNIVTSNYTQYDTDGTTVLWKIEGGKLYVYKEQDDDITLYAKWEEVPDTSYTVIVWQQKVTDDKNAANAEKTYDYKESHTIPSNSGRTLQDILNAGELNAYISKGVNAKYTGFYYRTAEMSSDTVRSDKTTVINIFYDRELRAINYYYHTSSDYPSGATTAYVYTETTGNTTPQYGLVGDQYVELSRRTGTAITEYYLVRSPYSNTEYTGAVYDANGNIVNDPIYDNTYYRDRYGISRLYWHSRTTATYIWTSPDNEEYTGTRFTRSTKSGYRMVTWTGLYGQSFAQNGYSWDNVSDFYWREGTTGTSGTGQTFLDAFIQDSNPYNLTESGSRGNNIIYHYRQQLDGTYTTDDRETAYSSSTGGFNFTNKFEGFTVSTYSTGNNGYSTSGGSNAATEGTGTGSGVNYPLHVYHTRNSYSLTLDTNYPLDKIIYFDGAQWDQTYNGAIVENEQHTLLYETPLTSFASGGADYFEPVAPDMYTFDGWYEDATCTVPFNFNSSMPASNKIVYAKWTPVKYRITIDPGGAEIDHINHTAGYYEGQGITPFRPDGSGYNPSQATYFNTTATELISEYTLTREYVEITDIQADAMEPSDVYYYINTQYQPTDGPGLPVDLRNAIYVNEDEIETYYQFYKTSLERHISENPSEYSGVTILGYNAWRHIYVSEQKYRKIYPAESYTFLGWYKNNETMPYDFNDPITEPMRLTARWRLDGGYKVLYTPQYWTADNVFINGNLTEWQDPSDGTTYADQASTHILQQPTGITADNRPAEDLYSFRGWRVVSVTNNNGNIEYTPLENGVYYQPGDVFMIQAKFADESGLITMQAVYEKKTDAYRRPEIANLILDANGGFLTDGSGNELTSDLNLPWMPVGTAATKLAENGEVTTYDQILFGDIQSNQAVHLYRYATDLTKDAQGNILDPVGTNYFEHPDGYLLLGFDNAPDEGDYAATYAADAVISVQRTDKETIYAVWEPMVYINFVNDTTVAAEDGDGSVTFGLSSASPQVLYIVNEATSTYDRVRVEDVTNITVNKGETLRLAVPQGALQDITVSGTNTLGAGYTLYVKSELDGTHEGRSGDPEPISAEHNKAYSITDTLVTDPLGITVTFTSEKHDRTLVLDDNYEGGSKQEIYLTESDTAYVLPTTSTRIGYEFVGWDENPNAQTPTYSESAGWNIANLDALFGTEDVKTLYAVWKTNVTAQEVYVYKAVPEPGDQRKHFEFTVTMSGTARRNTSATYTISESGRFSLSHGQYLKITSSKYVGSNGSRAYMQSVVDVYSAEGVRQSTETLRWQNTVNATVTFSTQNISVSETDYSSQLYDTDLEIAGQTTEFAITKDSIRKVHWVDTDTGGTVIVTNTRQSADVTVKKNLVDPMNATKTFSFTATAVLDGENVVLANADRSFNLGRGDTHTISDLPVGAVVTVTEVSDKNYTVSAQTSGTEDTNAADNICSFVVPAAGETVTFTNTLKTQPIRIVKVDEQGNPLEGPEFTLTNVTGNLYADDDGLIYANNAMYYGTYTLSEKWTPDKYRLPDADTTIQVSNTGVSISGSTVASVENVNGTYVVTITNELATQPIQIRKVSSDNNSVAVEGAQFTINTAGGSNSVNLTSNANGYLTTPYNKIRMDLVYGSYELNESQAAVGYEQLEGSITITSSDRGVTATGNGVVSCRYDDVNRVYLLIVENEPNEEVLPAPTGYREGSRSFAYLFLAGILIAAGAYIFTTKKRKEDDAI